MGFINFRGGQKADRFEELSSEARKIEAAEQEALGSKKRRSIAADYFGVPEWAEKENKTILALLLLQIKELEDIHHGLKQGNDLANEFDDSQLFNDFWMASLTEILNQGKLDDNQKTKCLQLLMTAFQISNTTTAKQHYLFISRNSDYNNYFQRCFSSIHQEIPRIWLWLEHLGNQPLPGVGRHDKNRMETTILFVQKYMSFMLGLSFYISQLFPGRGCGSTIKGSLSKTLKIMSEGMTKDDYVELDLSELVNPLYAKAEDYTFEYSGHEQDMNQAEGLRGVFASLRSKFGKENRILQLIQLLDDCSESDSHLLENEYKHMAKAF